MGHKFEVYVRNLVIAILFGSFICGSNILAARDSSVDQIVANGEILENLFVLSKRPLRDKERLVRDWERKNGELSLSLPRDEEIDSKDLAEALVKSSKAGIDFSLVAYSDILDNIQSVQELILSEGQSDLAFRLTNRLRPLVYCEGTQGMLRSLIDNGSSVVSNQICLMDNARRVFQESDTALIPLCESTKEEVQNELINEMMREEIESVSSRDVVTVLKFDILLYHLGELEKLWLESGRSENARAIRNYAAEIVSGLPSTNRVGSFVQIPSNLLCHSSTEASIDMGSEERIKIVRKIFFHSSALRPFQIPVQLPDELNAAQYTFELILDASQHETSLEELASYSDLLVTTARLQVKRDDLQNALSWFEHQAEDILNDPTKKASLALRQVLIELYGQVDSQQELAGHLQFVADNFDGSEEQLEAYYKLSDLYLEFWRMPEMAVKALDEAIERENDPQKIMDARLRRAKIRYQQGKYEFAIFDLEQILSNSASSLSKAPVYLMLGIAQLGDGLQEEGRSNLAETINIDEGVYREKALYVLAYSYIADKDYEAARRPFQDLIELYPKGDFTPQARNFISQLDRED